jgi:putative membrane protein
MKSALRNTIAVTALTAGLAGLSVISLATPAQSAPNSDPKLNDPTIVAIFDAANTWDIETGKLASERGRTKAVREFGAMIARDHKVVRQQGRDLAAKLGVTPTPPVDFQMAKDHSEAIAKLRTLRGAAFDRAFLAHEAAYHKAVLDAVTSTLLPALQNNEVKDLVNKVAPAFQAHMLRAKSLLDSYPRA